MITLQGGALIAELTVAALPIIALAGFGTSRRRIWLFGSIVALVLLLVTVTIVIESSTT